LAIGRASGSCRLTRRVAPSGVTLDRRCRVCAATRRVASNRSVRSLTARPSRPRRRPAAASRPPAVASLAAFLRAVRNARFALSSSRSASLAAVSARLASSPFLRRSTSSASSFAVALRVRSFAFKSWARRPAARDRSRSLVRTAPPAARIRRPVAAIRRTAFASNPESVGYATFDGTSVVSTRTRVQRSSFAAAAFANNASFSPSTAVEPHRVVSFINVVGCGTG
jgi:hypothetical protein